ncbi:MAG TPA: DNA polymerase III subunit alpha [Thermodesulfovibrionales bacterium]|nr:DNA polymerase III subunit alpha [Thermodesulfovibrionales bacterium]
MRQHSDYIPLHLHTEYSLLDGSIKIDELMELACHERMPAVAITDHGNLFGAVEFYKKASKAGVKPIIGCEVYVAPTNRFEKKGEGAGETSFHLILLAKDNAGYRNLVRLVSRAYTEGFYYRPRIDKDLLTQYSGGLIGLSACLKGEVPYYVSREMIEKARQSGLEYKNILGPENFYIEIQDNGLEIQESANRKLIELARELHIGVVATNDCHYLRKEDARAHDILLCIQTGKTVSDVNRMRFESQEFYVKTADEMKRAFAEIPEAVLATREIAERCNVAFHLGTSLLPTYKVGEGTPETYLRKLAGDGLKERFGENAPEAYRNRLKTELEIINRMNYASYFLIVWDFIRYARKNDIPVGPGRGSAAGSLVAYCLGITEIDPMKYNLLFERFLNPERISMPDIDVDFCKDRRGEVISYVAKQYGQDHVAQIITFGTMAAKAAIRDVGRSLDIPYAEVDRIAKLIPNTLNITIDEALKVEPQLKELYSSNLKVKEILDIAQRLEGLCRHASTHAAGVVVSPEPLTEYAPLYKNPTDGTVTTQFDMGSVEAIGLLKFDFLGLKTLTVIEKTIGYIKGNGADLSIEDIPMDDAGSYGLLSSGQTTGIFQLESAGMRDILVRMQPNRFEDLIALVALYRPGPMAWIDDFIKAKKGEAKISYALPQLKEILDETYGIILYQEQVMMIANKVANFSMGQADILRRAMGKKKAEEMEQQKEDFVRGAVKNGIPEKKARKLFEKMEPFAKYGFNKSHSAAYAYIAYQTAYLKAHFPVEFMAATLSTDTDNTDKIVKSIAECRKMFIDILPPDINESGQEFKVMGKAIRFGLEAVKGVGSAAIESILSTREKDGLFLSIEDFLRRMDGKKVNKKVIESLIKAGAFDSFGIRRAKAFAMLSGAANGESSIGSLFAQQDIFGEGAVRETEEWDEMTLLRHEKEALGFYITGHPLSRFRDALVGMRIKGISELEESNDKDEVHVAGVVSSIKKIKTKGTSESMAYLTLEDEEGSVEAIVFPELYRNKEEVLQKERLVVVKGTIDKTEKGIKIVSREIAGLEQLIAESGHQRVEVTLKPHLSSDDLRNLKGLLSGHNGKKGRCQVYLLMEVQNTLVEILTCLCVELSPQLVERIEALTGKGTVRTS